MFSNDINNRLWCPELLVWAMISATMGNTFISFAFDLKWAINGWRLIKYLNTYYFN